MGGVRAVWNTARTPHFATFRECDIVKVSSISIYPQNAQ